MLDHAPQTVYVIAIDRAAALVMLDDGCVLPVTNWLDIDGEELPSSEGAAAWVAGIDSWGWLSGTMAVFEGGTRH